MAILLSIGDWLRALSRALSPSPKLSLLLQLHCTASSLSCSPRPVPLWLVLSQTGHARTAADPPAALFFSHLGLRLTRSNSLFALDADPLPASHTLQRLAPNACHAYPY